SLLFEPLCNFDEVCERRTEISSHRCQSVPCCRWRRRLQPPFNDSFTFESTKTARKHLSRDALEVCPQFREATLAFAKIPDHIRRPRTAKQSHAFSQRAL